MTKSSGRGADIAYAIKYKSRIQLVLCALVSFVIACALGGIFASDVTAGLSFLFVPFLLLSMFCFVSFFALRYDKYYYDYDDKRYNKFFTLFNVLPHKFARFWRGEHSKASYRTYKKFLDSFGYTCSSDEERKKILDVINHTCRDNNYCFDVDERNWKEISNELNEIGVESNVKAVMSGVPVDDVFA